MSQVVVAGDYTGVLGGLGDGIRPMERISRIRRISGLVHPHTDWIDSHEELVSRWKDYSAYIDRVAGEKDRALVFVGTMPPDTPAKLMALDSETARELSTGLLKMRDAERGRLKEKLRRAGVRIRPDARYSILEELSLIRRAVSSVEPSRLMYYESSIDAGGVRDALNSRINPATVDVVFRGERPEVCVKDQGRLLCGALGIPEERLNVLS